MAQEKVPAHCDPKPSSPCRHHPAHSPGAVAPAAVTTVAGCGNCWSGKHSHTSLRRSVPRTRRAQQHVIFLEQIKFSPQHEEDNVPRYPRCGDKYPVLQVSVVSFTVTRCASQRKRGPAMFSEPGQGPPATEGCLSCRCAPVPPSPPLSLIPPCCL